LVEVHVLAGVEHIEATDPKRYGAAQINMRKSRLPVTAIQAAAGGNSQRETEKKVRPVREALGE